MEELGTLVRSSKSMARADGLIHPQDSVSPRFPVVDLMAGQPLRPTVTNRHRALLVVTITTPRARLCALGVGTRNRLSTHRAAMPNGIRAQIRMTTRTTQCSEELGSLRCLSNPKHGAGARSIWNVFTRYIDAIVDKLPVTSLSPVIECCRVGQSQNVLRPSEGTAEV